MDPGIIEEAVVVPSGDPGRRVAGLSLMQRTLLTLARAGVRRARVAGRVTPDARYAKAGLTVTEVPSLAAARSQAGGPALVVLADRVFEPALVKRLAEADLGAADAWLGGDATPVGCGIVAAGPALFAALEAGDGTLADALARLPRVKTLPIDGLFWQEAESDGGRARAERELFRRLRKAVDGPVARYVNRPISLTITRTLLIDTPITPNQMSLFAGLIGIAGVFIIAGAGTFGAVLLGAVLLDVQSILDGCDGEIARLKFQASKAGEWIDNGTDDALNVAYCAALGVAAARLCGIPALSFIGIAGGVAYAIFMIVLNYQLATVHKSGSPFVMRWWFQKAGADVQASFSADKGSPLAAALRALGRRDLMLLAFVGLAAVHLLQVAVVWYALIGLSNGGVAIAHVALGGVAAARRAEEQRGKT